MPAELDPTLRTHLREHSGVHATLYPHGAPTAAPMYLQPRTKPGFWFHGALPLATIIGAIMATDAGATTAGMAMALTYEDAPGRYNTRVASRVGTSQESEAMTLLLSVR